MIKRLLLFLVSGCAAFGATGDISSFAVLDNGWQLSVRVAGLATNQSFSFGWDTNAALTGSEKIKLNINSPGYNADGSTTTVARVIYGTKQIRFPYPSDAYPDCTIDAGDAIYKVALSEYVGYADVITGSTFSAGWVTDALAASNPTGSNWSAQVYTKPVVNNSRPPNTRITSSSIDLAVVGGHWSAREGQPFKAAHFIVTDESGDAASNIVTSWSVDRAYMSTGQPGAEAKGTVSLSSLTDGDLLTVRFRVFPHIGDAAAIFDSQLDALPGATPNTLPANFTHLYRTTDYGGVAVAGTVGASPTVYPDGTDPTTIPSTAYYGSGNAALVAIKAYNNFNYSHNDCGGGTVYFRDTLTTWSGASGSTAGASETWVTLQEYPGDNWVITTNTGNKDINDKIKLVGATLTLSGNTDVFTSVDELWLDQCHLDTSGSGPFSSCKVIHLTRSTFGAWAAGIQPLGGGQHMAYGIVRQNDFTSLAAAVTGVQVLMGNIGFFGTGASVNTDKSTWFASLPGPDLQVWYNNRWAFRGASATVANIANNKPITNGFWGANNIWEGTSTGMALTLCQANNNTTNVMWVHNLIRGMRSQFFYNEGSAPHRVHCYSVNSIFDAIGDVTDNTPANLNASRTNDWSVRWRVGSTGNINQLLSGAATHGYPDFNGIHTYTPNNGASSPLGFAGFIDDQAHGNDGGTNGLGNYRIYNYSTIQKPAYKHRWVLSYDHEGKARGSSDAPGPYSAGNVRKGAFF